MKLKKFLKAANGRICGGTEYQWDCFPNGQYTDVSDLDGNEVGGCIYNRLTMKVYQVEVHVYDDQVSYRWTHPEWEQAYYDEANRRNVDGDNAYDDVQYNLIDDEDEILHLLTEVVHMTYVHSKPAKSNNPADAWPFSDEDKEGFSIDKFNKEVKGLSPTSAWPFPMMTRPQTNEDDELDGTDADWGHDDSDYEISMKPMTEEEETDWEREWHVNDMNRTCECDCDSSCCGSNDDALQVPEKEFEVLLTVKHRFSVKARNMEQAIDKAKLFEKDMKSGVWPKGLCWEDRWVSKTAVSRRLETTNIEE